MQKFSIRDIENMCGIKAHTLRIWEKRYNFLIPQRQEGNHRIYSNEELKKLLRIAFLYHQGYKVSSIAALTEEEIIKKIQETEIQTANYKNHVLQLIEVAIDFDEAAFRRLLNQIIEQVGFETCMTEVCFPYLLRIGHLWSTNNVIPAQEHFSSYVIQHMVIAETEKIQTEPDNNESIILFTPVGEHHELPLLYLNYLLKKKNWNVIYLGKNVKLNMLQYVAENKNVQYFFLHIITNLTGMFLDDYLEQLCKKFTDKKIFVSGMASDQIERNFLNVTILKTDSAIYDFIDRKTISEAHSS